MRRVAVIGYGVEGHAAVEYWRARGDAVAVHDRSDDVDLPTDVQARTGTDYLSGLDQVDLVVRSPGVRPDTLPPGPPVTSVTAEFLARCPALVIGVTGTKGKGTTASAIASIVRAAGRRVFLGGNIGTPPLTFLPQLRADDVVVLELSSFQLMDLTVSPHVAVVLSITPDHLNWHRDLDEYYLAKGRIAAYQSTKDSVVYVADSPVATAVAETSRGQRIPVGTDESVHVQADGIYLGNTQVLEIADVPLLGSHNLTNVAAAIAAAYQVVGSDHAVIRSGIQALTPLPHRLTHVATVCGVTYIDDSCSMTPETAAAAMATFDVPQVLILGGTTKGVAFDPLATAVSRAPVRSILLVGTEAHHIAASLDAAGVGGYEHATGSMTEVVRRAAALAQPGDVVLLSPGCASIGEFRDYADRGQQFAAAVHELDR